MDSLRSLLPKVLRKRGLHKQAEASLVVFRAQEWLEKLLPRHGKAIEVGQLSHAVLSIRCSHGIAAQECRHLLPSLRDYLAKECPDAVISEIRLIRSQK
jgi:hypothetical protein